MKNITFRQIRVFTEVARRLSFVRAAEALHAALEIHRRALALERGGRGEDQVGPAGGERGEERDDDHVGGA